MIAFYKSSIPTNGGYSNLASDSRDFIYSNCTATKGQIGKGVKISKEQAILRIQWPRLSTNTRVTYAVHLSRHDLLPSSRYL